MLQVILSGGNREDWVQDNQGLNSRDIADAYRAAGSGRPHHHARDQFQGDSPIVVQHTEVDVVRYQPDVERVNFLAELSRRWCRLRSAR